MKRCCRSSTSRNRVSTSLNARPRSSSSSPVPATVKNCPCSSAAQGSRGSRHPYHRGDRPSAETTTQQEAQTPYPRRNTGQGPGELSQRGCHRWPRSATRIVNAAP